MAAAWGSGAAGLSAGPESHRSGQEPVVSPAWPRGPQTLQKQRESSQPPTENSDSPPEHLSFARPCHTHFNTFSHVTCTFQGDQHTLA